DPSTAGAETRRGLLDFRVQILDHWLQRSHDKGQPDEYERHRDAERRESDRHSVLRERLSQPSGWRVQRRQHNAGDRGGQREWQGNQRVNDAPPREKKNTRATT